MTYIALNAAVLVLVIAFQVITLDAYIKRLVDDAIAQRCLYCEFKKSKMPEDGIADREETDST